MRRVVLALFGTIAGLVGLLSFKTHPASVASPPAAVSTTGSGTDSSGTSGSAGATGSGQSTSSSAGASPKTATSSSAAATTKTVTGSAVDTQYGPVQVRIAVRSGKVVSATAIVYPMNDPRDAQINSYAIPILEKESAGVTSANIDTVSGATFTSEGYLQSLQSALDKAGI